MKLLKNEMLSMHDINPGQRRHSINMAPPFRGCWSGLKNEKDLKPTLTSL